MMDLDDDLAELDEAFETILSADKKSLARYYDEVKNDCFSDSSAVHTEKDLKAWIVQMMIKKVLGHLHGVPSGLLLRLDNKDDKGGLDE